MNSYSSRQGLTNRPIIKMMMQQLQDDPNSDALPPFYQKWKKLLEDLKSLPGCRDLEEQLSTLIESLRVPFSLAVLGRIKTGKSTLINAFIGKKLSLIGIEETTALINRISFGENRDSGFFTVHWKNKAPETRPIKDLEKWNNGDSHAPGDCVDNTEFLELFAQADELRNYHIIDTPGTGSIFSERDEIAKQFIRGHGANAMIYVLSHSGHDSDRQQLGNYRDYMQNVGISSQDYCIAVLQKWDEVFWNTGSRNSIDEVVLDIEKTMGDLVYRVIPVIAPLGLVSHPKNALGADGEKSGDAFWSDCLRCVNRFASVDSLCDSLLYSDKWDLKKEHKKIRLWAEREGVPWNCFRLMLRELKKNGYKMGEEKSARKYIWELSGMGELVRVVKERFFQNASLLRAAQVCAQAEHVMQLIIARVDERLEQTEKTIAHLKIILGENQHANCTQSVHYLNEYMLTLEQEKASMNAVSSKLSGKCKSILSTHFDSCQRLQARQMLAESGAFIESLNAVCSESRIANAAEVRRWLVYLLNEDSLDTQFVHKVLPVLTVLSVVPDEKIRSVASYLKLLLYRLNSL